jgi:hypothetical protein
MWLCICAEVKFGRGVSAQPHLDVIDLQIIERSVLSDKDILAIIIFHIPKRMQCKLEPGSIRQQLLM